jgi:hypothetical protein
MKLLIILFLSLIVFFLFGCPNYADCGSVNVAEFSECLAGNSNKCDCYFDAYSNCSQAKFSQTGLIGQTGELKVTTYINGFENGICKLESIVFDKQGNEIKRTLCEIPKEILFEGPTSNKINPYCK